VGRELQFAGVSQTPVKRSSVGETLIFLHIPKTAGTTLNRIIEWQYNPLSIFTVDPHHIRATTERFATFPEQRRRRLRVIRGHLLFGIHELIPQNSTYITLLREPVSRVLSSYNFILRRPLHPLHRKLKREHIGPKEFIQLIPHAQNLQCRFIAGIGKAGACDDGILHMAKENLRRYFRVVGLSERFHDSLLLMAAEFGWKVPVYKSRKVATVRPTVDSAVTEMIREHNRFDIELYQFARELFEESMERNSEAIDEISAASARIQIPSHVGRLWHSSVGMTRFLTSKLVSAL
jgi:Galactose-3-O-sulfotransferase